MTAEDMFRFFFNGGFAPMNHPHARHRQRQRQRAQGFEQPPQQDPKASLMSLLFAFLPFLLIILMNFMSGSPVKHYSMTRSNSFPQELRTFRLRAPFFVNDSFGKLSPVQQSGLMTDIDNEYYHYLYNECVRENHRSSRMARQNVDFPEGSWCRKFQEAKRIMQPGY